MSSAKSSNQDEPALPSMQWSKLMCDDRFLGERAEDNRNFRTPYQVDRDRIVYSQPFRRLQDKTQVHPLSENDHIRTRLTHTIEVGAVGRTLGWRIGRELCEDNADEFRENELCESDFSDVLQAACYAHDIGNPPFGHFGEHAIREWFRDFFDSKRGKNLLPKHEQRDFLYFDGNAQGLRVLTRQENRPTKGGLQLTYATLAAFTKYPWSGASSLAESKKKIGLYSSELKNFKKIANNTGLIEREKGYRWCRHPLAHLVEAADDISYALSDLEDAVELKLISYKKVEGLYEDIIGLPSEIKERPTDRKKLEFLRERATQILIDEVATAFRDHENTILRGAFQGELLDHAPKGKRLIKKAKGLARDEAFKHQKKIHVEVSSFEVMSVLLQTFVSAVIERHKRNGKSSTKTARVLDLMGNSKPETSSVHEALISVIDHISGMTDHYAIRLFRQIQGVQF